MPDSEAILTIRPSPAARMAVNAARPHRNEPVRLTPIVSSQMSNVVSPKGADVSTPAAQTRARRPASQCPGSATDCGPGVLADDAPVELFVSIQTPFQVQMPFGMLTACCARDLGNPPDPVCGTLDIVRCDQETGHAIGDYLTEPTAIERD